MSTQYDIIAEIQQVRSEFQLRHFVIGQHDTPEMQFYQCCIELQSMEYNLAAARLAEQKMQIQMGRLIATGDELDQVEAEIINLDLQQQALAVIGAEREVATLRRILAEMPVFTREQIERAQPEYWTLRLIRQSELQKLGNRMGVGHGQLDAMRQAGLLPEVPQHEVDQIAASFKAIGAAT